MYVESALALTPAAIISDAKVCRHSTPDAASRCRAFRNRLGPLPNAGVLMIPTPRGLPRDAVAPCRSRSGNGRSKAHSPLQRRRVRRFCRLPSWLTVWPSARSWWRAQVQRYGAVATCSRCDACSVSLTLARLRRGYQRDSGIAAHPPLTVLRPVVGRPGDAVRSSATSG
jgi:hypothetical protein